MLWERHFTRTDGGPTSSTLLTIVYVNGYLCVAKLQGSSGP